MGLGFRVEGLGFRVWVWVWGGAGQRCTIYVYVCVCAVYIYIYIYMYAGLSDFLYDFQVSLTVIARARQVPRVMKGTAGRPPGTRDEEGNGSAPKRLDMPPAWTSKLPKATAHAPFLG